MKIGFIGLGIMGKPMVKNLLKSGQTVLVNDVNNEAQQEMQQYGAVIATTKEIAQQVDCLITSLPNGAIVKAVLYSGENAVLKYEDIAVKHVIDTSSLTPNESLEISKVLEEKNVKYVDAPVSGGNH
ncbi:NAD(P)-binding domain-containing protein [Staphylococcus arlettae]|nr:NAD(P)-binding domain-containing protein [Staphylococcus arlettae]